MQKAKTIAAFHDLSSVGRCALTVVIPVISAMGVQVIPAPTAVLSAHTAFPDFVVNDLTDYLEACIDKWDAMGFKCDCVYTGYFANTRQEEIARRFIAAQPQALRVIDPVMGDDGELYKGMPSDMPQKIKALCNGADVITPNLTEAALLTGEDYFDGLFTIARAERLLEKLMALGPKYTLLTGARFENGHANLWMDRSGEMHACPYRAIPAVFPGTGDLFASVIAGAMTRGTDFESAVKQATDYVQKTMEITVACGTDPLEGVQLEQTLPLLQPLKGSAQ